MTCYGGDEGARSQGVADRSKDEGGVQDSEAGGGDRGSSRWRLEVQRQIRAPRWC